MSGKKTKRYVSRRDFIKGAAVGAGALSLAGLGAKEIKAFSLGKVPRRWNYEADVVVVGYGGGGAAAAITAHDSGAKVLLLEKMPVAGGNTRISGGIIYGCNTSVQKACGITDSPGEMYKYYQAVGEGMLDPARIKIMAEKSGDTIEWLIGLGLEIPAKLARPGLYMSGAEKKFAHVTPPKPRGHASKGGGAAFFGVLKNATDARKIEALQETSAKELIVNDEREVVGVVGLSNGKKSYIKARKGVILTSGGFSYSKEMKRIYRAELLEAVSYCTPGLTGDGIRMAQAIGANLENMGNAFRVNIVAKISPERGALVLPLLGRPCVMVNKEGKRFINEDEFYEYLVKSLLQQEDKLAYIIFDEDVKRLGGAALAYGFTKELRHELKSGVIKQANTISALARVIGISPATLEETVSKVNKYAMEGNDRDFGRKKGLGSVKSPPFYCVEARCGVSDTVGGLKTNSKAEVADVFGKIIPRLYAAGSTTDGWMFKMYPGSGTYICNAINFGRIAGENAAALKPWA